MTRSIVSRLKFPRLQQQSKMSEKSAMEKLKAKGVSNITVGDVAYTFINKRQKTPTACGYLALVVLGYLIVTAIRGGSQHAQQLEEEESLEINPKFQVGFGKKDDPQEAEFQEVLANNQGAEKPQLPVFNVNKHVDDIHPVNVQKKENEVKRYGYPAPKQFPVDILAQPNIVCPGESGLLLMVVTSHPDNGGGRNAIRATWGTHEARKFPSLADEKRWRWRTIFVMGRSGTDLFDKAVTSESDSHHDLLVGDFHDTPHEDTRKLMLAMRWIDDNLQRCSFTYVLKTKDDIYHNMVSITNWLEAKYEKSSSADLYVGKLLRLDRPIRDSRDPLHVPEEDFPGEFFPDLIHSPVYLFRNITFFKMAENMAAVTPIAMEDAYIGLLAKRAEVKPAHNDHFQLLGKTGNVCHHLRMFFISPVMPSDHLHVFKNVKLARTTGECQGAQWVDDEGRHRMIDV